MHCGVYDRFAGRAIFPWLNVSGKVVAFGGRKLDAATKGVQQKYVNSPDSEIYHKERELYGIYQAKKAIVKEDCVYMVEGYTDVIAMHQCGLENVVANSGTALSNYQIRLLHRFTPNLLLPDGDDPDSFSRKHTAQQFKEYIEQHQTDFIEFKTDLLLKNVKDPVKRAEAINNIVRSVSVIPDPIVRATYITECSRRLDVNERTLISQTNKYIAGDKEEQRRIEERENRANSQQPIANSQQIDNFGLHTQQEQVSEVERLIIQSVIRHGEEIIFEGLETDDGGTVNLNVAQYVDYDLSSDGLSFSSPLYNTILQEAVEHSAEPDFKAFNYFMQHPDPAISQLAATLGIDSHQLSKSFEMKTSETSLRQRVQHLILDFRLDIVSQQLKRIQQQMKEAGADMEKLRPLMDEYKEMLELRNALARQRGSDVMV